MNHKVVTPVTASSASNVVEKKSDEKNNQELNRFFSGGVAGFVSRTCTAPLDRVKILRQINHPDIRGKNVVQCFKVIIQEGGVKALWRGNGINVIKNGPETALRFSLHSQLKEVLFPEKLHLNVPERMFVASLSGSLSMSAIYPIEVVKTRMALRSTQDNLSLSKCFKKVYSQGGIKSFYRGYFVSMLSYIPYSGMELCIYELAKRKYLLEFYGYNFDQDALTHERHQPHLSMIESALLVMVSCLVPMGIVYPANLLRTRFQAATGINSPGIMETWRGIIASEGLPGLYRGFYAQFSKTFPTVCISYMTFEAMLEYLKVPGLASR